MKIKSIDNKVSIADSKKRHAKMTGLALNKISVVRIDTNDLYDEICNAYDNSPLAEVDVCKAVEFTSTMSHNKGKKVDVIVSNTLELRFDFGYIRIKPNNKNGVELCSMVVFDGFRGQGRGTTLLNLFKALLFDAMSALIKDDVEFGDVTLTAAANIDGLNQFGVNQRFTSPMRQKLEMYTKLGFSVSKMHNPGLVDMTLNVEKFLSDCLAVKN